MGQGRKLGHGADKQKHVYNSFFSYRRDTVTFHVNGSVSQLRVPQLQGWFLDQKTRLRTKGSQGTKDGSHVHRTEAKFTGRKPSSRDRSQAHRHDAHVPRLAQGDRQRHTQERVEGVALFQAVGAGQGRSVRAEDTHGSCITLEQFGCFSRTRIPTAITPGMEKKKRMPKRIENLDPKELKTGANPCTQKFTAPLLTRANGRTDTSQVSLNGQMGQ